MTRYRELTRATVLLVVAAIIAGCGDLGDDPYPQPARSDVTRAEERMRQLPSFEATTDHLRGVVKELIEATARAAPELDWRPSRRGGVGHVGCTGPYGATEGTSMDLGSFVSDTPISEEHWPAVLAAARDVMYRAGITDMSDIGNRPGDHDVSFHSGDTGNKVTLGTLKAAVITATTGCRFRQAQLDSPSAGVSARPSASS